ncbi:MAG: hypothetical protein ACRDRI_26940 [Pseudonocardiaceae bacterium]
MSIDKEMCKSLGRVVGRDYGTVEWYGLELEPTYEGFPGWPTSGNQFLIPHFRVGHDGAGYGSLHMGLGEFSVHLLFWILWQFRDSPGKIILLDESDAYLPPGTRMRFLVLILTLARKYERQLVMTSHSEALISAADEHGALVVLSRQGGIAHRYHSSERGFAIVKELIAPTSVDLILFCEDESAAVLVQALLNKHSPDFLEAVAVIWKDGDGYLRKLAQHLPRTDASPVRFTLVFDGDQRPAGVDVPENQLHRWPVADTARNYDTLAWLPATMRWHGQGCCQ